MHNFTIFVDNFVGVVNHMIHDQSYDQSYVRSNRIEIILAMKVSTLFTHTVTFVCSLQIYIFECTLVPHFVNLFSRKFINIWDQPNMIGWASP